MSSRGAEAVRVPDRLTHYHRPFVRPLQSLSELDDSEVARVVEELAAHEPLPFRLQQQAYLPERRRIEQRMRARFIEKGGRPQRERPHYFVLGEFSLWESDGSKKLELPLSAVSPESVSFTLTDSFFNYRRSNFHGVAIPPRDYHDELFMLAELAGQLLVHDLPTEAWRSDPERRFEVYVEAQLWSDAPFEGTK